MLAATALVLLMTPALGLFYAGLVRSKNTLNTFMMCIAALAVATVTWALVGYSLAFDGDGGIIGGLDHAFLHDVDVRAARRHDDPAPALLGLPGDASASSRSRWSPAPWWSGCASAPFLVFAALWSVLVYAVLAHWAFGGGWLQEGGTLDFAGGVPVEMGSGFSALAAALVVGARKDYGRQALLPHNAVYVLLGAGPAVVRLVRLQRRQRLLDRATRACSRSPTRCWRPACTLVVWFVLDLLRGRKVTAIGAATAIIVGCVGITPAGGFVSPGWAMAARRARRAAELRGDRLAAAHAAWTRRSTCSPRTASRASPGSCSSASSPRSLERRVRRAAVYGNAGQLG